MNILLLLLPRQPVLCLTDSWLPLATCIVQVQQCPVGEGWGRGEGRGGERGGVGEGRGGEVKCMTSGVLRSPHN